MSFHQITALYQEQIDELNGRPATEELIDEVHDVLEEYCCEVELAYGVNMIFEIMPNEEKRIKYEVIPASDLDTLLLKYVIENESQVGRVSFTLN